MNKKSFFSSLIGLSIMGSTPSAFAAKTLVYCAEASPHKFNPQIVTDGASINNTAHIYDTLVRFTVGETTLEPSIAKSWEISKDGLTYTFKLRNDIEFHTTKYFKPTRKLNADDVIFSFDRQRLKDHYYHKVNGGTYEYFSGMGMDKIIKDIKKLDSHTIQFTLSNPEAPFLANLGMPFASILSKEYADSLIKEKQPEKMAHKPVGTGPFIFKKYAKDQAIHYTANKNYFGGAPKIDKLVFAIAQEASVRYQKMKREECHVMTYPSPSDIESMKKNPKLNVMSQEGLNVGYLSMNQFKKPFDNKLVRQAINHALNKESYIKAIYFNHAKVAKNPIPPTIWSYNNSVKDYKYDPMKAKELLKKAGFPKGFSTELWTLPVSRPYNPNGKRMGEMMQADLAKVGIKVKLVSYEWGTYLEKARNDEHSLIQLGWTGDNGDPDNFLNTLLGCSSVENGSNNANWCFKPYDDLIQKAKRSTDVAERTKHYEKAQEIFKQEAPWATIAHSTVYKIVNKKVSGFKIHPFGTDYFHKVDIKK